MSYQVSSLTTTTCFHDFPGSHHHEVYMKVKLWIVIGIHVHVQCMTDYTVVLKKSHQYVSMQISYTARNAHNNSSNRYCVASHFRWCKFSYELPI